MSRHHKSRRDKIVNASFIIVGILFLCFIFFAVFFPQQFNRIMHTLHGDAAHSEMTPRNNGIKYDGIDVSHHQGDIDWLLVASDSNISFVYIKATEGSTHIDTKYDYNIKNAKKAGLNVGSYHFFTSSSSAVKQFDNFKKHVDKSRQDLLPMVDVESSGIRNWNKQQLKDSLAVFIWLVKKAYGRYPLIYSDAVFYTSRLSPRFDKLPLFIARYNSKASRVKKTDRHFVWQVSENGSIDGINHSVDLDVFAEGTTLKDILLPK